MAQWYGQLVFKDDTFLGEGLSDFALVEGVDSRNGGDRYTTVVASGYALYGRLRGFYSLGVAHLTVDPSGGSARYISEASALHRETASTLTPAQRAAVRDWLINLSPAAWENSTEVFRQELEAWAGDES